MLRHFFVTAMLAGVNVKVARMLTGHHSAAFRLDVYADALPQQMDEACEKVADVITGAIGSILVANSPTLAVASCEWGLSSYCDSRVIGIQKAAVLYIAERARAP
jgi:hypothetical protein